MGREGLGGELAADVGEIPAPLNDGDVLTIGSYELLVEIAEDAGATRPAGATGGIAAPAPDAAALIDGPDGDFLDDLLGEGAPLTGPAGVKRSDDFDKDGLLPPLDEDDLLGSAPGTEPPQGASQMDHADAAEGHYRAGTLRQNVIPEDWDADDLFADDAPADPSARADGAAQAGEDPFSSDPFDLEADPAETLNLYPDYPDKTNALLSLLRDQILDGRSTPGPPQANDPANDWPQIDPWLRGEI